MRCPSAEEVAEAEHFFLKNLVESGLSSVEWHYQSSTLVGSNSDLVESRKSRVGDRNRVIRTVKTEALKEVFNRPDVCDVEKQDTWKRYNIVLELDIERKVVKEITGNRA
ncbi:hypothetical protein T4B_9931 [Trichinella pseudospiralis]|uniref:Uncharacterized protein n=1 Tax=Trichinella pseudospiralis TaxID=6337 RepID=A0A0V1ESL3_TRIPS|nr:hypothetical protein T4A_2158 [Trichinella pseudospiralis]KRZ19932.1 hypothetical protein T4B_9931 [Trichinella pseudospiralis]KRZ28224.1 hypothetical protein T4C_9571 [Trichinella pseudospiralis]